MPRDPTIAPAVRSAFTVIAPEGSARVDIGGDMPQATVHPRRGVRVETTFEGDTRVVPVYRPPRRLRLTTRSRKDSDGAFGEVAEADISELERGKPLIVGLDDAHELTVEQLSPLIAQADRTDHPLILVILHDEHSA